MGLLSRTQSLQSAMGLLLANSLAAVRHWLAFGELKRCFPFSAAQVLGRFLEGLGEVFWSKKTYKENLENHIKAYKPYKKDFPFWGLRKVD